MGLYFYNGQLLFRNGQLAMSEDCCCDKDCFECIDEYVGLHADLSGYGNGEAINPTPPSQSRWEILWGNLNRGYDLIHDPAFPNSNRDYVSILGEQKDPFNPHCEGINPGILIERLYDDAGTLYALVYAWKLTVFLRCISINGVEHIAADGRFHIQCCTPPGLPDVGCNELMPCGRGSAGIPAPLGFAPFLGQCNLELRSPEPPACFICPPVPLWANVEITHCPEAVYTTIAPTPPQVQFTFVPSSSPSPIGIFNWTTTGQVDRTTVSIDDGPDIEVVGTFYIVENLAVGPHSFRVRVENDAGSDSKTHNWNRTGDPDPPPTVTLTQTPPSSTSNTSATFGWSTNGNVDVMTCQLDGGAINNCVSPITYNNLSPGLHTFRVTVSNPQGSDFEQYNWTITEPAPLAPTVTLTQMPPSVTTDTNAQFAWTTTGTVDTTTCQLDGGALGNCTSPKLYTNLLTGPHTFTVTVANAQGSDEATYEWTIDPGEPSTLCQKVAALLRILGGVANVDLEVTLSGVINNQPCSPGWNRTVLYPGPFGGAGTCEALAQVSVQNDDSVCGPGGGISDLSCRIAYGLSASNPSVRIEAHFNQPGSSFEQRYHFEHFGASAESLVDQMLATGQCVVPFTGASPGSTDFDFSNAVCTLRVFPR